MLKLILITAFAVICSSLYAQVDEHDDDQDSILHSDHETEEITVTTTRSSYHIEDAPLRVEVLGEEELGEKMNMRPSSINLLLSETPGIRTEVSSSFSGSQNIKMQGLSGRYTQILKDGFPIIGGLSSGLGILQIPPLDLKQVEVIKGPSSTLYGGNAISGLINLISKTPEDVEHFNLLTNLTSRRAYDLNAFYSNNYGDFGVTFLANRNFQPHADVDYDGFSDMPFVDNYSFNPKLFFIDNGGFASLELISQRETREGGSVVNINKTSFDPAFYTEKNRSTRTGIQGLYSAELIRDFELTFKTNYITYNRDISGSISFSGEQRNSFNEASVVFSRNKESILTGGINYLHESFNDISNTRNYDYNIAGAFVQHDWELRHNFTVQTGFRADYEEGEGIIPLPRLSFIYKVNPNISIRGNAGMGYKMPSIFTEEIEEDLRRLANLLPLNNVKSERSIGGTVDISFNFNVGEVSIGINPALFYTEVSDPLILNVNPSGQYFYSNAGGKIDSRGIETSFSAKYDDIKLFGSYVYTDAHKSYTPNRHHELIPEHFASAVLVYENHDFGRIGYELYYNGKQYLSDGAKTPDYTLMGIMAEKYFENFNIFLNFENITDVRQSNYGRVVLPPYDNPVFKEIFSPLEGFLINGGVKIKL